MHVEKEVGEGERGERNDVVRKNRIEENARSRRVEDQVC